MRVVARVTKETWSMLCKCRDCRSELEVKYSDLKEYDSYSRSYTFTCPVCSKVNYVIGPSV